MPKLAAKEGRTMRPRRVFTDEFKGGAFGVDEGSDSPTSLAFA